MDKRTLLTQMVERAETDEAFRTALIANPQDVLLRETGLSLQELGTQLRDEELVAVAGGLSLQDPNESSKYTYWCDGCSYGTNNDVWWALHQASHFLNL